mmetsp:Transcript_158060/g.484413  ORF Transcript_158060/g.484413 Transcript_158060/m.484413 type:complete len:334 (-) Transcript_158060:57-1058(-)
MAFCVATSGDDQPDSPTQSVSLSMPVNSIILFRVSFMTLMVYVMDTAPSVFALQLALDVGNWETSQMGYGLKVHAHRWPHVLCTCFKNDMIFPLNGCWAMAPIAQTVVTFTPEKPWASMSATRFWKMPKNLPVQKPGMQLGKLSISLPSATPMRRSAPRMSISCRAHCHCWSSELLSQLTPEPRSTLASVASTNLFNFNQVWLRLVSLSPHSGFQGAKSRREDTRLAPACGQSPRSSSGHCERVMSSTAIPFCPMAVQDVFRDTELVQLKTGTMVVVAVAVVVVTLVVVGVSPPPPQPAKARASVADTTSAAPCAAVRRRHGCCAVAMARWSA